MCEKSDSEYFYRLFGKKKKLIKVSFMTFAPSLLEQGIIGDAQKESMKRKKGKNFHLQRDRAAAFFEEVNRCKLSSTHKMFYCTLLIFSVTLLKSHSRVRKQPKLKSCSNLFLCRNSNLLRPIRPPTELKFSLCNRRTFK